MTLSDIDAGDIIIFIWCLESITLTLLYGLRSPWWQSTAGKIMLFSFFGQALLSLQVSITLLTDSGYYARDIVRPIAYAVGAIGTAVVLALVWRMQGKDRQ